MVITTAYEQSHTNPYPTSTESNSTENQEEENGHISASEDHGMDGERRAYIIAWLATQQRPSNITEPIEAVENLFGDEGEEGDSPHQGIIAWLDTQQQPERIEELIEVVEHLFESEAED